MACKAEHLTPSSVYWNKVIVEEQGTYPNARLSFVPVLCNQCGNPPCESVCPTGATFKRADGLVALDQGKCIGCGYCIVACPYRQRTLNGNSPGYFQEKEATPLEQAGSNHHTKGTVTKCNFCYKRLEQGKLPACVAACPARARIFGDLHNPESEISQLLGRKSAKRLLANLGTDPAVFYIPD
jgi:molybdopterin-containing oxidoreductase family iron-sulfur binding subunit